jgi:H+-translocating NAD(P) transhydrogenase subunit alpha
MIVAIVRETHVGEKRVALIPAALPPRVRAGVEIVVESGSGLAAGFSDAEYTERGARVVASRSEAFAAEIVLQVRTAGANPTAGGADLELMRRGQSVIGLGNVLGAPQAAAEVAARGASLFDLALLPRTSRAQGMDVLSSQATIAGYRAVLLAASALPKIFPLMTTAAGTLNPAKVFIVGAGVAGLQAIATARRLGALVSAFDVRPAVKEQVQSLGARFVELDLKTETAEDAGGYARQMDAEAYDRQRDLMKRVVAESDVVITTALVPGKKAPVLVTAEMVAGMASGSVIVDVAAEQGGNCELTQPGRSTLHGGVTILGPTNLPAEVPWHASQLYAKNITTFLLHLVHQGRVNLDLGDDIVRETLITHDGEVVHPRVKSLLVPGA